MKQVPFLLALFAIATAQISGAFAQPRSIAAHSAERGIVAITQVAEPYLVDGDDTMALDLPRGARVATVEALAEGWVATGTISAAESQTLLLLAKSGELVETIELPTGIAGRFAAGPVPLIEFGSLVGLAWLEGDRYDAYAVRAASWNGKRWSEVETLSEADLASQLALSGAVLADGSWVLVWSAVEDGDDDIFWARRAVDGTWAGRQRLTSDNRVPDIHPTVLAQPAGGALVSWTWFDGSDYRVRLAGLESDRWEELDFLGPSGSTRPSLLAGDQAAYLLYRQVVPDSWVVEELDPTGRAWRRAAAARPSVNPPGVAVDESGVTFSWPASISQPESKDEVEGAFETMPWSVSLGAASGEEVSSLPSLPPPSMAEPGAVVYRAFGDSVMRGSGDPVAPAIVFDIADDGEGGSGGPACAPNGDPFAILCGVNWRLETTLDLVFASDVANDGYGGEETPDGITRLENVVLPAGGDVVFLMEATNDISYAGTSNTTILANLGTMIDKATAAGFDTGIASVIKRRKVDSSGNPIADPANDTQTQDLRNSIDVTLAPTRNRVHIDAWSALDPTLGDADYWDAIGNGDCCGHPDKSGYDKLEPKFRNAILADPVLAAPVPIGPSGNTGLSPTFTWNTSGNARLYQLSVTGPGGSITWWDALAAPMSPPPGVNYAGCSGGTCSANLGALAAGSYTWRVRGKNLRGPGPFSSDLAFEVPDCTGLPANIFLDGSDTGSTTYHACPGSVTSQSGFVVAGSETVTLWGTASVVIEEIVVQAGATLTLRSD